LRGYGEEGVVEKIRAAGGEVYAITSEPHSLARNAAAEWATGFEHIGDPHQEISAECRERGWLSLFTNDWGASRFIGANGPGTWVSHPKGYFQPGVLALTRGGRVLYRWRCRPTRSNLGGAVARPLPGHVWSHVEAALAESGSTSDAPFDDNPQLDSPPAPWPIFVLLLLSNGWFLRPRPFDQRKDDPAQRRIRNAALRLSMFFALWIALFWMLPLWIGGLALAAWVAMVAPAVREVNRLFQNIAPDEEPSPTP